MARRIQGIAYQGCACISSGLRSFLQETAHRPAEQHQRGRNEDKRRNGDPALADDPGQVETNHHGAGQRGYRSSEPRRSNQVGDDRRCQDREIATNPRRLHHVHSNMQQRVEQIPAGDHHHGGPTRLQPSLHLLPRGCGVGSRSRGQYAGSRRVGVLDGGPSFGEDVFWSSDEISDAEDVQHLPAP